MNNIVRDIYPPNKTAELTRAIVLSRRLTRIEQIGNLRDRRDSPRGRMNWEDHESKRQATPGCRGKYVRGFGSGSIGFIDWLEAALELPGRRLTLRGRGYSWRRYVTLSGKVFLQLICDSLFDHVLNGIGKRRGRSSARLRC